MKSFSVSLGRTTFAGRRRLTGIPLELLLRLLRHALAPTGGHLFRRRGGDGKSTLRTRPLAFEMLGHGASGFAGGRACFKRCFLRHTLCSLLRASCFVLRASFSVLLPFSAPLGCARLSGRR